MLRPVPRLQALTVEKELSFEYDDIGMGESDDEVGDDEVPKGTGESAYLILNTDKNLHRYVEVNLNAFVFPLFM